MYKIYGDVNSGNCYKIKLLMHLLGKQYEWVAVDILKGETRTSEFQGMNQNMAIPVLQVGVDEFLPESNAILNYIAEGTDYLPDSGMARARVLQWQFFEQYSHEPYIAVARFINKYLGLPEDKKADYEAKQAGGHRALRVMQEQLAKTPFLTGDQITIADISLFAYTHVAHEGGFDLGIYSAVEDWIERIRTLPAFVAMG